MVAAVCGAVLGFVFAGSPSRIAGGVKIDGVNVGGLTAGQARAKLERRANALAEVPVTFTAAGADSDSAQEAASVASQIGEIAISRPRDSWR